MRYLETADIEPIKDAVRESVVEKRIREDAEADGWFQAKLVSPGKRAMMDRVFIKDGVVVFMEVKRPGKKPTRQQQLRAAEMRTYGANVTWTDNHEDAINLLKGFYQAAIRQRRADRAGPSRVSELRRQLPGGEPL